ncbi:MAG: hypothetical protein WCT77_14945 [Bacteroidota bacterium]
MQKQKVYIETCVISYLTAKPSRDIVITGHQKTSYGWVRVTSNTVITF